MFKLVYCPVTACFKGTQLGRYEREISTNFALNGAAFSSQISKTLFKWLYRFSNLYWIRGRRVHFSPRLVRPVWVKSAQLPGSDSLLIDRTCHICIRHNKEQISMYQMLSEYDDSTNKLNKRAGGINREMKVSGTLPYLNKSGHLYAE